jgi:hypothetical protein
LLLVGFVFRALVDYNVFLLLVMPTRPAPTQVIATHGVVDVAALDVTNATVGDGGDMWVDTSDAKAEVAIVEEVAIREAGIVIDWNGVEASPSVPALQTEHAQCHEESQAWKISAAQH